MNVPPKNSTNGGGYAIGRPPHAQGTPRIVPKSPFPSPLAQCLRALRPFENLPLFFGVLNLLLLGMLLGLAVIAQALQSYLQSLFVSLLLWGRARRRAYQQGIS